MATTGQQKASCGAIVRLAERAQSQAARAKMALRSAAWVASARRTVAESTAATLKPYTLQYKMANTAREIARNHGSTS